MNVNPKGLVLEEGSVNLERGENIKFAVLGRCTRCKASIWHDSVSCLKYILTFATTAVNFNFSHDCEKVSVARAGGQAKKMG